MDQQGRRYTQAGQTYPEPSPYDRLVIDRHVRFAGDVVAILAGKDEKCVDKAMKLIKVRYEVLPAVLDYHTALDNPVLVHPEENWESLAPVGADNKRNLCAHDESGAGDIEAVLAGCDVVIDHTYHTRACQQAMMETFRTYCSIDAYGRLNVLSSTQIVFHCRRILANALHIPKSMIRVAKPRIGGGFGAKQTSVCEVYPAFVTWKTKKPSKIIFSRYESQIASTPRHEMELHVRLGATKDGIVRGIDLYTLSNTGALVVKTGKYTGRSANDKFIVDIPAIHDDIAWGKVNRPMDKARFDAIYAKVTAYLQNKEVYVFDGFAGADPKYTKSFRIVNELASQNLFIHQLLRRPTPEQLADFTADYTIVAAPGFKCVPEIDGTHSEAAILVDYEAHLVVICGTRYAGEIKKSVFSVMNYILPKQGVFPMHCSANIGTDGDSAVFFGLSGTGKTTLSADPDRKLIGDDEHGWADDSVFNFEGGCYAKCINLSAEGEPEIYNAIKFGALVENVVMDPDTREFDFDDDSLAVNSRVGYPVEYIPNAELSGMSPSVPKTVIFLTADAYGVLPPISKLDRNQAMYYFVSGFTSKVAGTEIGVTEPVPTFSTCFGEPFLPLDPSVYAAMLAEKVEKAGAKVYLVNTGWNGTGQRMKLRYTRAMVTAALTGAIEKADFVTDPTFGVQVPTAIEGVPSELLIPENTWADKEAYRAACRKLASSFVENFKKYTRMSAEVVAAGPKAE